MCARAALSLSLALCAKPVCYVRARPTIRALRAHRNAGSYRPLVHEVRTQTIWAVATAASADYSDNGAMVAPSQRRRAQTRLWSRLTLMPSLRLLLLLLGELARGESEQASE